MKDFDCFEKLFIALQTEAGKDLLKTNCKFRSEFIKLKIMLEKVYKVSGVPHESFELANHLLQQVDESHMEYDIFLKKIDEKCDALSPEYPFLFSELKQLARTDRKAVETILNELTE